MDVDLVLFERWRTVQERETLDRRAEADVWPVEELEISAYECLEVGNTEDALVLSQVALQKAMKLQGNLAHQDQILRCYTLANQLIRHFGLYQPPPNH